jgi:hypothetical protein
MIREAVNHPLQRHVVSWLVVNERYPGPELEQDLAKRRARGMMKTSVSLRNFNLGVVVVGATVGRAIQWQIRRARDASRPW